MPILYGENAIANIAPDKRCIGINSFLISSQNHYVVGTHQKRLCAALRMNTDKYASVK